MIPAVFDPYYPSMSGLGADELPIADQAVIALVGSFQPVGLFTPWAVIDGTGWKEETNPQWNYLLYPVTTAILNAAEKAGGGTTGFIVVLTDRVVGQNEGAAAFAGSRYEWFETDAVYRQDAPDTTADSEPRMHFLVWGRARDPADAGGGSAAPEAIASKLEGALVFPIQQAPTPIDQAPRVSAATAMAHQFQAPMVTPAPAPDALPAAMPAAVAPTSSKVVPVLLLVGLGAGATYLGYRWASRSSW